MDVALAIPSLPLRRCHRDDILNSVDARRSIAHVEHIFDAEVHDLFKHQERVGKDELRRVQLSEDSVRVHAAKSRVQPIITVVLGEGSLTERPRMVRSLILVSFTLFLVLVTMLCLAAVIFEATQELVIVHVRLEMGR